MRAAPAKQGGDDVRLGLEKADDHVFWLVLAAIQQAKVASEPFGKGVGHELGRLWRSAVSVR